MKCEQVSKRRCFFNIILNEDALKNESLQKYT